MDLNDWRPYWVSQKRDANVATIFDIEKSLIDNWVDQAKSANILKDLEKFFVKYHVQIRPAWNPAFLEVSAGKKFYEQFTKECDKMSRATVQIKNKEWIEKTWPLAFFTMYHYRE